MSGTEIREKVDQNNELIRQLMNKFDFTLNDKLTTLINMNNDLRAICQHEFIDGVCKYCDEIEVKDE